MRFYDDLPELIIQDPLQPGILFVPWTFHDVKSEQVVRNEDVLAVKMGSERIESALFDLTDFFTR
jgi:hypothetical protein